ncbi:hypothetical protein [Castellaniella sp.]|uniref:hypothetical protein n=1 Tax=Castellaniella sp. TaxID=1955812 RepID=UPI002AFE3624|nr:hypothetical protein [Castellaniella sp.]
MATKSALVLQTQLEAIGFSAGIIVSSKLGPGYAIAARVPTSVYRAFETGQGIRWTINIAKSRHGLPVLAIVAQTAATQLRILANLTAPSVRTMLKNLNGTDGIGVALMLQSSEQQIGLISPPIHEELPRLLELGQSHPTLTQVEAIADMMQLGCHFLNDSTVPPPAGMTLEDLAVITILEE